MQLYAVDLVSDLHIDQWDSNLPNLYPCGRVKNFPFKWDLVEKSPYLIVAGDISDDLEISLSYLDEISQHYKKILFVDGNHEHVHRFPDLIAESEIQKKLDELGNSKLIYLPLNPTVIDGVAYLGMCGWWDYFQEKKYLKQDIDYFKSWRKEFGVEDCKRFIDNVRNKAEEQILNLQKLIEKFHQSPKVHTIVMVTHTVPLIEYSNYQRTEVNSLYQKLMKLSPKFRFWFFGHTHQQWDSGKENKNQRDNSQVKKSQIRFISNPRGRPDDYDREEYQVKQIVMSKL
jgi:hypothetical protein